MIKKIHTAYYSLPPSLTVPIDCLRRKKYWLKQGVIFIHVPKAAGTSISHALYGRSLGHFKAQEIKKWCPKEFERLIKFSFVRNPWDRLVSAYKFACIGSTETAGVYKKEQYKIPEFNSFEVFVNEWLSDKDLTNLDNIFQPQYIFLKDLLGNDLVDYVGKVENIDNDINNISNMLNKKIEIFNLNKTERIQSYKNYYTNDLVKKVADIYKKDIEAFGYDF